MTTAALTPARRRFMLRCLPALAAFTLVSMLMPWLMAQIAAPWLKLLVVLLPIALIAVVLIEMLRHGFSEDELFRREHMRALSLAGLLTCFLTFAWGMLETWVDAPRAPMVVVLPLFAGAYGFAFLLGMRRFT